jgi:protein bicaudal C
LLIIFFIILASLAILEFFKNIINKNDNKDDIKEMKQDDEEVPSSSKDTTKDDKQNESIEERFQVDRKKLEQLLQGELSVDGVEGNFFDRIGKATNTTISWPAKLKLGAKSKKDPHIKVAGLPDDIQSAKQMILSVMDTKTTRVTLKMDVSFADHSHIIGKGGNTIKKVMQDTNSHIHNDDSNTKRSESTRQNSSHPSISRMPSSA